MKKQVLGLGKIAAMFIVISVLLYSCGKTAPAPSGPTGPASAGARAGGYQRTFSLDSAKYTGSLMKMTFVYKGKPDTCYITLAVTATQYGNYTLSAENSPNYATMTIRDKGKDTVYMTDQWHRGYLQLTTFDTQNGSHNAAGNFSFICIENTPVLNGRVDTAVGSFSNVSW